MFIDTHCHLLHHKYGDAPVADRLRHAQEADVRHMILIACAPDEWQPGLDFATQHSQVSLALGLHPQDVNDSDISILATLESLVNADLQGKGDARGVSPLPQDGVIPAQAGIPGVKVVRSTPFCVAIGETGLDYHYDNVDKKRQHAFFHEQLAIAERTGLPAVIHTRDAEADTIAILQEHKAPFVIHCFSGTQWLADEALKLGGFISFSGILTFKKAPDIRAVATTVPHDKILLETDAPYLAPEPHRSSVNEPALMPHTANVLAGCLGLSVSQVAQVTTQNAARLFTRLPLFS